MKKISIIILLFFLGGVIGEVYAQSISISGTVYDNTNEPLPGASVTIKGLKSGTITDQNGEFKLTVPNSKSILTISFISYITKEVAVGNNTVLKIKLEEDNKALDEVVIVGFSTQKKVNVTGAVKTIGNESLESRPIASAVNALQGVVAGLNITNDLGGAPGQSMSINIRGSGTIGEGSNSGPLVLIDGLEGDLSTINPNDIENISVLKDAASSSIFGSRAPFGVIIVTTKSGKAGNKIPQITYSSNVRISTPLNTPKPVDSYTFGRMVNDAYINSGGNPQFSESQLSQMLRYQNGEITDAMAANPSTNTWNGGQMAWGNTNWYDVHLKKQSVSHEHNLTMNGGGEKVQYYFSTQYLKQNGLYTYANDSFSRLSINGKVNVKILDNLKFDWNTRLVTTVDDKPTSLDGLFFHNLGRRASNVPVYLPNGDYNPESLIPALTKGGRNTAKGQTLYNQAFLTWEPIKNWKIYGELSNRLENPRNTRQVNTVTYRLPDGTSNYVSVFEGIADKSQVQENGNILRQTPAGTSSYEKGYGYTCYFNTNLRTDYLLKLGKHELKFLVGMQSEVLNTEMLRLSSDNFISNDTPFMPSPSGSNVLLSETKGGWSNLGVFGRITYNYESRYMLEANYRIDGASRFAANKRWATFPSFSAGWNIGNEQFWVPVADAGFDVFKLRGSYGVLGNQNTSNFYPYFQQMKPIASGVVIGGKEATSLPIAAPFSTSLTWEKIANVSIGADLGFFNNRLNTSLDWFKRTTRDMVGPAKSLPGVFGAAPPKMNNAELTIKGWELELSYQEQFGKDWSYNATFSFSDYKSTITKYDSPNGAIDNYYKGKVNGDIWGYEVEGIAKSDLEMQQWLIKNNQNTLGSSWGAGDFMYRDLNGDGAVNEGGKTIYNSGDKRVIGNSTPRFSFGLRMGTKWKFLDASVFFQGIGKRDITMINSATFLGFQAEWQRTLFEEHLDYFRPDGDPMGANLDPYYARLHSSLNNNRQENNYYLQNGAYVRLKNLQIGFTLPQIGSINKYIKKARIYFSGENLWTFSKLMIVDPESAGGHTMGSGKVYPMNRTFSVGISVTL